MQGVVVQFSKNGWMTNGLTCDYLKKVFGPFSFTKWLIVWDVYKCHTSEETQKELNHLRMYSAVIPGGCTKLIQAPDVVWNAIFKITPSPTVMTVNNSILSNFLCMCVFLCAIH